MKKTLLWSILLWSMSSLLLSAGVDIVKIPHVSQWEKGSKQPLFTVKKNAYLLQKGVIPIPGRYKTAYGETVIATMLFNGKGLVRIRLIEYDPSGKVLFRYNYQSFLNPRNEQHIRSLYFDIRGKNTAYFSLNLEAVNNTALAVEDLTVRRAYGEENKLYSTTLSGQHWREVTQGVNLAAGKKIKFFPKPTHFLTKRGNTDPVDLTDGKLSTSFRNYIWFDPKSVGWEHSGFKSCALLLDLGKVCDVEKAVMRICGGRLNVHSGGSDGMFPDQIQIYISKDGVNYYRSNNLQKLQINEKEDCDWENLYYLPEVKNDDAPTYVYPFQFPIEAQARYIYMHFKAGYRIFVSDELAVIQSKKRGAGFDSVYKREVPNRDLFRQQAVVRPYYDEFHIAENVLLPNWLKFSDTREKVVDQGKISFTMDLPSGVSLVREDPKKASGLWLRRLHKTEVKGSRKVFTFRSNAACRSFASHAQYAVGPFYFKAESAIPEKDRYLEMKTYSNEKLIGSIRMKLSVIHVPAAPRLKKLLVCGSWFTPRIMLSWPGGLEPIRHVGLNALSVHGKLTARNRPYLKEALSKGFKIISVPDNMVITQLRKARKETSCILSRKMTAHNNICPSYRGKYFKLLCSKVEEALKDLPAEYLHLDYELWFSPEVFKYCSRCEALRKQKQMKTHEFAEWVMADFYKHLILSARSIRKNIRVGSYLFCADRVSTVDGKKISMFGGRRLFPEYLDELHTVHYGRDPLQIQRIVRSNYLYVKDPSRVLIYLTAGTGAYQTDNMGDLTFFQLLEAYMNGAGAIAYFVDRSFASPVDYLYMAQGIRAIAPHEKFLMESSLDASFAGTNKGLGYTMRRKGKEALLLVGNYNVRREEKTFLPLKGLVSVQDTLTHKSVRFGKDGISLIMAPGSAKLLKLRFK